MKLIPFQPDETSSLKNSAEGKSSCWAEIHVVLWLLMLSGLTDAQKYRSTVIHK
jgi:hypothetical protein